MKKKDFKPKKAYIDGDSILFFASSSLEITWRVYKTEAGEEICRFKSVADANAWLEECQIMEVDTKFQYQGDVTKLIRHTEYQVNDDIAEGIKVFEDTVKKWVKRSGCEDFVVYIGAKKGQKVFRHDIATIKEYKGSRTGRKPEKLDEIRKAVSKLPYVKIARGNIEVDDVVQKLAQQRYTNCLISIDKDARGCVGCFLMIPDDHDKPVFSRPDIVGRIRMKDSGKVAVLGWLSLMFQCLTGDTVDSIKGLPKYGKVKAYEILKDCDNKPVSYLPEVVRSVLSHYYRVYGLSYTYKHWDGSTDVTRCYKGMFEENLRLLYMVKHKDDKCEEIMDIVNSVTDEEMEEMVNVK